MNRCPVLIAGAGALGSFFAARFITAGAEVAVLARGERLAQLMREGLEIETDGRIARARVPASADCCTLPPPGLIVLACKCGDLGGLLAQLQPCIAPDATFLTLQNGVEAPHLVAQAYPSATVLAARVHGFFELQDGLVRHVGVTPSVTFGLVQGSDPAPAEELARLLAAAGITHRQSSCIVAELWEKLLIAASLGGVGAAYGMAAGEVFTHKESRVTLSAAMAEVQFLAGVQGVGLESDCTRRNFAFAAGFPADATTSLQRDLKAGRPSEYGDLVGAVLRLGRAACLALPTFVRIDAMIRARGLLDPVLKQGATHQPYLADD